MNLIFFICDKTTIYFLYISIIFLNRGPLKNFLPDKHNKYIYQTYCLLYKKEAIVNKKSRGGRMECMHRSIEKDLKILG